MAILQFSTCGRDRTAVPVSIHCDHLISAYEGAEADLKVSLAKRPLFGAGLIGRRASSGAQFSASRESLC